MMRLLGMALIGAGAFVLWRGFLRHRTVLLFVTDTHGPAAQNAALAASLERQTGVDALLHGGDLAESSELFNAWWAQPFNRVIARIPIVAATGNHDDDAGISDLLPFGEQPRRVSFQDVDVFVVPWPTSRQSCDWLVQESQRSTVRNRILLTHRPVWAPDGSFNAYCLDACKRAGINLILAGHSHVYWDSMKDGIRQIIDVSGPKKYECPSEAQGCVSGQTAYWRIEVGSSISARRIVVR